MICISNFVIFSIFFNTVIIKTKNKINKYSKKIFSNFFQKCINFEIENGKKRHRGCILFSILAECFILCMGMRDLIS